MTTAIITLRESIDSHGVGIDILESTYVNFFENLNLELTMISNFHKDVRNKIKNQEFDLVVLTGGGEMDSRFYDNKRAKNLQPNRDKTEYEILDIAIELKKPVLAVCRGMQFVNGIFGGKTSKLSKLNVKRPVGKDHPVTLGSESITVNSFHEDGIFTQNLANGLDVIAIDAENRVVEGFYSFSNKILGIQWHPERTFHDPDVFNKTRQLIKMFINNNGAIDESYYIGGRSGNKT